MRILIVKLSSIGDVVHTLPAAAMLRRAFPDSRIGWVVERRAGAILEGCPVIDELIVIDTSAWRRKLFSASTIREIGTCLRQIRGTAEPPDVVIDFQGLMKSGLVTLASRSDRRVGLETADLRERASRVFLDHQVRTFMFDHVIEKNVALARWAIRSLGGEDRVETASDGAYEFPIHVSPEDEEYVERALGAATGRSDRFFAIINPGGGWPTKLWSAAAYGRLADWLREETGLSSVVTYGPGEEDLANEVVCSSRSGETRPLPSTLKQLVALARRARLFIGGDSGPLHIAAACGTAIVGLYGPTSPERNGPFRSTDLTVGRDLWCRADCHRRSCWHWECMDIPVEAVQRAIEVRLRARSVSSVEFSV